MSHRRLQPNYFTYPFLINVLSQTCLFDKAKQVHCRVLKTGFLSNYAILASLFDVYLKLGGGLSDARRVFDEMCSKPVELWNRMISEYGKIRQVESAKRLFENMPENVVSYNVLISAYAGVNDADSARQLFQRIPDKNVVSWTSMIVVYASLGDLDTAKVYFDQMPIRKLFHGIRCCLVTPMVENSKKHYNLDFIKLQSSILASRFHIAKL